MCGIVGVINRESQKRIEFEGYLTAMRDTLMHRGPDGFGNWISENGKVGFGHRRLSIIDLSEAGKQPMSNPERTIWITYNGEIYNHLEIRAELEKLGYRYHSGTDTETIIYAYQEWGIDCLNKFNGMFAIGLWDSTIKTLFLVRDRIGIKPLYYMDTGRNFLFASEIKAFFKHPDVKKNLSGEGLYHYMSFGATPAPYTLFENIYKVPAGHYLKLNSNFNMEVVEWWNPLWNTSQQPKFKKEEEYSEYILNLLRDSVKLRTMSDVPYGAFLSGGLDSSLISALMTEQTGKSIDTYSVDVEGDNPYSEQNFASIVAKKINSNHYTRTIKDDNFEDYFIKNYQILDEPLTTQDFVALHHLSKLTREHNTIVIQDGIGSDELFMGYEGLDKTVDFYYKKFLKFKELPVLIKDPISFFTYYFYPDKEDTLFNAAEGREFYWTLSHVFGQKSKMNLFSNNLSKKYDTYTVIKEHYDKYGEIKKDDDLVSKMLYLELKQRLPEAQLLRDDRVSMANSIELRVPFLDYRIVEFSFNIPFNLKIKEGIHKYILKKSSEKILPKEIIYRKKLGFCNSIDQMLTPKLKAFAYNIISSEFKRIPDTFNRNYIQKMLINDKWYPSKVWTLLNFAYWYKTWID